MLVALTATNNSAKYKNYLNAAVKYLTTALVAEIQKNHPGVDIKTIDYNDPKWKPLIEKLAYRPAILGSLAVTLGLDDKIITEEMWDDIFAGWIPAKYLPEGSHLLHTARETPKGLMVPLSNNPSKFEEDGTYVYDGLRRPTNEALFSLGKGLSIWIVAKEIESPGTMKEVEEMHNTIMREHIIPEMERLARIRQMENGEVIESDAFEMLCVSFMHIENRNEAPSIHFHPQVINSAMAKDGRLYATHTDAIYEHKAHFDALYQSKMKSAMEQRFNIPYEKVLIKRDADNEFLTDDERNVASYDISSEIVPEELKEHYAQRIREIEAALKAKGIENTPGAREVAQKSTRSDKSEMSPSELIEKWKKEFAELGFSAPNLVNRVLPKKLNYIRISDRQICRNFQRKIHIQARERQVVAIANLSEEDVAEGISYTAHGKVKRTFIGSRFEKNLVKSFITRVGQVDFRLQTFKAHIVKQAIDTCDDKTAWSEAERIANKESLLYIHNERAEYFKPLIEGQPLTPSEKKKMELEFQHEARFITKQVKLWADYIQQTGMERKGEAQWVIPSEIINEEIFKAEAQQGFLFSADQLEGIKVACGSPGSLLTIQGLAGTGKSTAAKVIVSIFERCGYNVHGTSIANTATKGLAKSAGMSAKQFYNSTLMLMMMDKGELELNESSIIVFDEAAMADLETYYRLIKHANDAKAKIIFMGESKQLNPVGPGNNFKFLNENFTTIPLTSINRQKEEQERQIVHMFQQGEAKKAMEAHFDNGNVTTTNTVLESLQAAAEEYVSNPAPETEKILMSSLNGDNDMMNSFIKKKLQENGGLDVGAEQITVKCSDGVEREYGEGDRVGFFKSTQSDDMLKENIDNSDTGVVHYLQKSSSGRVTALVLKMDKIDPDTGTNELRFIDITKKRPAMRHAWAGTIYKAQGGSVPFARLVVTNSSMDANTIYVAASRHKVNFKMFLSKEFMDTSLNKIKHQDISEKQKKKLTWLKDEKKIDIPEVAFESYGQADFYLKNYVDVQLPDPADRTHAMDNFSEVITRMSKFTFKSNVADFTEIENGAKLLKDIEAARLEDMAMFRNNRGKLVPVEKPVTSESSFGTKSRAAKMRAKKAQEKAAKVIPQLPIDPIKKQKRASLAKGI